MFLKTNDHVSLVFFEKQNASVAFFVFHAFKNNKIFKNNMIKLHDLILCIDSMKKGCTWEGCSGIVHRNR